MIKNKALNRLLNCFISIAVLCLILFNTGCGLDTFYYIYEPDVKTKVEVNSSYDNRTFKFTTNEYMDPGFVITGTDVYYKIYSNLSDFESETKYLVGRQADTDETIFYTMKDTYKYSPLRKSKGNNDYFIPYAGRNQVVEIRLNDYLTDAFRAKLVIDGVVMDCVPVRNVNKKNFNFWNDNKYVPLFSDSDVHVTSSPDSDHIWYVAMFAVTTGHDVQWSNGYSKISYLGAVSIKDNDQSY